MSRMPLSGGPARRVRRTPNVVIEALPRPGGFQLKCFCRSFVRRHPDLVPPRELAGAIEELLADWPDGCTSTIRRRCDVCDVMRGVDGLAPWPRHPGQVICLTACARRREWSFNETLDWRFRT